VSIGAGWHIINGADGVSSMANVADDSKMCDTTGAGLSDFGRQNVNFNEFNLDVPDTTWEAAFHLSAGVAIAASVLALL
jgi:hypothetical protein